MLYFQIFYLAVLQVWEEQSVSDESHSASYSLQSEGWAIESGGSFKTEPEAGAGCRLLRNMLRLPGTSSVMSRDVGVGPHTPVNLHNEDAKAANSRVTAHMCKRNIM